MTSREGADARQAGMIKAKALITKKILLLKRKTDGISRRRFPAKGERWNQLKTPSGKTLSDKEGRMGSIEDTFRQDTFRQDTFRRKGERKRPAKGAFRQRGKDEISRRHLRATPPPRGFLPRRRKTLCRRRPRNRPQTVCSANTAARDLRKPCSCTDRK